MTSMRHCQFQNLAIEMQAAVDRVNNEPFFADLLSDEELDAFAKVLSLAEELLEAGS